jgi:hypothetical protein
MILWKKNDPGKCLKSDVHADHGDLHQPFWKRPNLSRRQFFRITGTGVAGYYLTPIAPVPELVGQAKVAAKGTARHCIFILLSGAPSHVDTFDLKEGAWTPATFNPTSYGDIRFPQGLMPTIAEQLGRIAIVRSMRAYAVVHGLGQTWVQIGRNPTSGMGRIAPHVGSIVAIEKSRERRSSDFLPPFISLNAGNTQAGAGYLSSNFAPFSVAPNGAGLPNTTHGDGQARFNTRLQLLNGLDGMRTAAPYGGRSNDLEAFGAAGRALMYNPAVQSIFTLSAAERARYGQSPFGDACLTARSLIENDKGTRFVQLTFGGWDMHSNIYAANNLPTRARQLDLGLGNLLSDLGQAGLLDSTLVVMVGEFGRTVGALNNQQGRDHYFQQFVMFAGAGINGNKVIGQTDAVGRQTVEPGWSRNRDVRIEDIESTLYSALGIDWTSVRYDDPFGRGFEYVPFARDDVYGPINELWA